LSDININIAARQEYLQHPMRYIFTRNKKDENMSFPTHLSPYTCNKLNIFLKIIIVYLNMKI